jgi:hypothetical protein
MIIFVLKISHSLMYALKAKRYDSHDDIEGRVAFITGGTMGARGGLGRSSSPELKLRGIVRALAARDGNGRVEVRSLKE